MVVIDGERAKSKTIADNPNTYLPSNIFVYYSGKNDRVEELFRSHLDRYNRKVRSADDEQFPAYLLNAGDEEAIEERERQLAARDRRLGEDLLRRLFYCRGGHTQLVLLACFLSKDPFFEEILKNMGIEDLESALFVLKQPHYLRGDLKENEILNGDSRFWFAGGTVVAEFLDKLWEVALAPIDDEVSKRIDFRGRKEKQKQLYLFVESREKLEELAREVGPVERFFRYAEGAYIGDLIEEVRINVKHRSVDGSIAYGQLSEGELQLLTVLGLMRITKQDHCLFLLDEPDTHLNPIWKLRYFDLIEQATEPDKDATLVGDSQTIITTHDPLMIGSLRREQVRVLRNKHGRTIVDTPDENPQGMGVTGLLKSELFGLASTVDSVTTAKLHLRNYLFALGNRRTAEQDEQLTDLSRELSDLGFSQDFKDPYFAAFVKQMALHTKFHKPTLTPEEIAEQDAIADEIVTKLLAEEGNQ
jgi:ABC-type multidrug transport system ATPase subunit